jgi:predicted MPP superfamily phosphohydrolase
MAPTRTLTAAAAAAAGSLAYGTLIERNAYVLRRAEVPVLPAGTAPLRVLHLSDLHMTAGQQRKGAWVRDLADLEPDLVVNTGDTFCSAAAIVRVMHSFEPLFAFPGVFVPGNNDYYAPRPKNPLRYFTDDRRIPHGTRLPWSDLAAAMAGAGWTDLTHIRTTVPAGRGKVALAGTDDPHLNKARYDLIAGPADDDADVRIGVTHSPEPVMLSAFAADGYDLVLAGHTHGGQVRVPFGPAIVTNCGMDRWRARGLHRWDDGRMWFHISAGVGTNPWMPIRFACRPEATLLTLVAR